MNNSIEVVNRKKLKLGPHWCVLQFHLVVNRKNNTGRKQLLLLTQWGIIEEKRYVIVIIDH